MTSVTLRPDSTVGSTGAVTGAASSHAALNDNSDSSYVTLDVGEFVTVGIGNLALPADAVTKTIQLRGRVDYFGNGTTVLGRIALPGQPFLESTLMAPSPPPGTYAFASGGAYTDAEIDAATVTFISNGTDTIRVYEAYVDVVYVTQPSTSVFFPTGTVTNTTTPIVNWSMSGDAAGGSQTHYQIRVFTAAQYGIGGFDPATSPATWDSGITASIEQTRSVSVGLQDATYRAYVRTAQTVNGSQHWSTWGYSAFTINVVRPPIPLMNFDPQEESGRILIELDNGTGGATTDGFELQRSVDNGLTWLPVRNTQADTGVALGTGGVDILDYEAPNGQVALYRARALHNYSGVYAASDWNTLVFSFEDDNEAWIQTGFTTTFEADGTSVATTGSRALHAVGTITNNDGSAYSPPFQITPGRYVSARADIYVGTAANGANAGLLAVQFDDGTGAWTLTAAIGANIAAGTGPRVATILNAVAPATATQGRLRIYGDTSGTSTIDWLIDTVQIRIGSTSSADLPGVMWESSGWWLKHPTVPSLNMPIELFSYANVERAARRSILHPVGALRPVVISDTRGSEAGIVVAQMHTETERDVLDALLDTTDVLLLQGPAADGEPDRYVSLGDTSLVRVVDNANFHIRRATLPWVRVDLPAGAITGGEYIA